ncbi:Cysteinyl-tRNA synthetase [Crenothrix polyspora]|uniref:Cysteinyl-tRNA synthetase n=1 Tax=Crenothrix polyspora TaxID=360316 RepID=A0A1R4HBP8_9GAMM|nr:hypothetical protein [Crenothrix polyspora]SJM93607.1 Cysteinyl-tRNA synthetase [Crenothrix polyspora]
MTVLSEGRLQFTFGVFCLAEKYDDWSFFRNQFQNTCGGAKAVDFICLSRNTSWLIEVKDYRQHKRTKPQDIGDEIAIKVRDTLAGLVAAKVKATNPDEKTFAKKALQSKAIKVVLHLEQPEKHSKLFPRAIDPASVMQSLKRQLKAIDAHPKVVDKHSLSSKMDWDVIG